MLSRSRDKKPCLIYYVVDEIGWVQHKRLEYLAKYQDAYRLKLLSARKFRLLWKLGFLRKKYIFFSSWRTPHAIIKTDPDIFKESDFLYFMAAVTSHSNIGSGLDPLRPIPTRRPEEAFDLAVGLLKRFKIVTVNSMILYDLISGAIPDLVYCPNGVDTSFFRPDPDNEYPDTIRIGWTGKARDAKNYQVIESACKELESTGRFKAVLIRVDKESKRAPFSIEQMREFYRNIDYYLCASWNEGTPNPALEAGACGVPVVSTRVGNMRELIKDGVNGYFIDPTVESIVARFEELRKIKREEYIAMSMAMRDSISLNWSWEKRIENFILTFDDFAGR